MKTTKDQRQQMRKFYDAPDVAYTMTQDGVVSLLDDIDFLESESAEEFAKFLTDRGAVIDYGFEGHPRETVKDALSRFKLRACNVRASQVSKED